MQCCEMGWFVGRRENIVSFCSDVLPHIYQPSRRCTHVGGVEAQAEAARGDDLVELAGLADARDVLEVLLAELRVVVEVQRGPLPGRHLAPEQRRRPVVAAAVEDAHRGSARVVRVLDQLREDARPLGVQLQDVA